MGICTSYDPRSGKSQEIDKNLQKARKHLNDDIKVLLLGPGESGKSTIFKQMKIVQDKGGFALEELQSFTPIVHDNCISQMKVLIENAQTLSIALDNDTLAAKFMDFVPQRIYTAEVARLVLALWADKGIQKTYSLRGQQFHLNDTAAYFFEHAERFATQNYVPTTDDVLRARVRSTGIEEAHFTFESLRITMVDVGGQRSERRKWIHLFSDVTAILFVASLSDYDQKLREDNQQNAMAETILLFNEMANRPPFDGNSIILFLNKLDLFTEKVPRNPISVLFPTYEGPHDVKHSAEFIKEQFKLQSNAEVYAHFTCALDTTNVQVVIRVVRDWLLKIQLKDSGVYV